MIRNYSCKTLNVNTVHLHRQEDTVLRRTELSPNHRPGGETVRKNLLLPEGSDQGGSPSKFATAVPSQCPLSHARHAGKEGRDGDTCSWVSGVLQTQGVGTPTEPGRSPIPGPPSPGERREWGVCPPSHPHAPSALQPEGGQTTLGGTDPLWPPRPLWL